MTGFDEADVNNKLDILLLLLLLSLLLILLLLLLLLLLIRKFQNIYFY